MRKLIIVIIGVFFIVFYLKDYFIIDMGDEISKSSSPSQLELLKSISKHNYSQIRQIIDKNPVLLNSQTLQKKWTPLMWAVKKEYIKEVKLLLELGADPNIKAYGGNTALLESISLSRTSNKDYNVKITELLLKYGANPNIQYCDPPEAETTYLTCGETPLMKASIRSLKKIKLLLKYGANINQKNKYGETAASIALLNKKVKKAYFLIVKNNASIGELIDFEPLGDITSSSSYNSISLLRSWIFKLDSEEYRIKMEIVNHLKEQGLNYWETKPTKRQIKQIQFLYPNSWQDYLIKY